MDRKALVTFALAVGLASGLVEGGVHLLIQRLGVLDNSWYPIVWIAAVFNGLLVGLVGCVLSVLLGLARNRDRAVRVSLLVILVVGCVPWLALLLKNWLQPYAVALLGSGVILALARLLNRDLARTLRAGRRALPMVVTATVLAFIAIEGGSRWYERTRTERLPEADSQAPNVLVIVIDALRADHLSSYGYRRPTSPAIDRLAAEGVLFENAFSTSSYTLPTHASMLTGLYPWEHSVSWDTSHQGTDLAVLPEALLARGYRTAAFSGNTFYFSREHGFGRGFLHFEDFFHSVEDMAWRTAYGAIATRVVRPRLGLTDLPGRKRAPETNRAALAWVRGDRERPFFVMINYMDVHDPYLPPEPYRSRFSSAGRPGGRLNFKLNVPDKLTPDELQGEIDAYDGAISFVDDAIRELLADLRQASSRDLIVIITSDHGEEFGEHGGYLHARHLYREAIHVPLIIAGQTVSRGLRPRVPVTNASIPATVMALIGADGGPFRAPSLTAFWTGTSVPATWPSPLAELRHRPWAPERDPVHHGSIRSLVTTPWHLIAQEGRGAQLFDWVRDPSESQDLAGDPGLRGVVESLVAGLAAQTGVAARPGRQ